MQSTQSKNQDPREYIRQRVSVGENGCWDWTLGISDHGYGYCWRADTRGYAHRFSWEAFRGAIPAGSDLDHLCRNRKCVNPDHLEPVSRRENLRRGQYARNGRNFSVYFVERTGLWTAAAELSAKPRVRKVVRASTEAEVRNKMTSWLSANS